MDLFDGEGRPLSAVVDGYSWTVDAGRAGEPEPERLEAILRRYFARLRENLPAYAARAEGASSLRDLIQLRADLAREQAPGLRGKLFRQSWG